MSISPPTPFTAALLTVLQSGPAVITFTDEDLFLLANDDCPPSSQVSYTAYRDFKMALDSQIPTEALPDADLHHAIYKLIRLEILKLRRPMLNAIAADEPNCRRFCWLLDQRAKQERANKPAARKKAVASPITKPETEMPLEEACAQEVFTAEVVGEEALPMEVPQQVDVQSATETAAIAEPARPVAHELSRQRLKSGRTHFSAYAQTASVRATPPPPSPEIQTQKEALNNKLGSYMKRYTYHR